MADLAPNFKLGSFFEDKRGRVVEYAGAVVRGDFLEITGVTTDKQPRVEKHTGAAQPRFVAIYDGGDPLIEALHSGQTKVRFGASLDAGESIAVKDNEVVPVGTAGASNACGYCITPGADGDDGLVYFDGGAS